MEDKRKTSKRTSLFSAFTLVQIFHVSILRKLGSLVGAALDSHFDLSNIAAQEGAWSDFPKESLEGASRAGVNESI